MMWTRDTKRTFYVPDDMWGLPTYKKEAHMWYMSGLTETLLHIYGVCTDVQTPE